MCPWKHIASHPKEGGKREAGADLAGIRDAGDMPSASRALYDALKRRPDRHVKSELIACFQSRLQEETDASGIYDAFEDMYRRYKQNGDPLALNIARMLGEKAHGEPSAKGENSKSM